MTEKSAEKVNNFTSYEGKYKGWSVRCLLESSTHALNFDRRMRCTIVLTEHRDSTRVLSQLFMGGRLDALGEIFCNFWKKCPFQQSVWLIEIGAVGEKLCN